jgi:RES domain-containing protein
VTASYRGKLYRALNPIYAREPLSGEGARRYGGRFNPKGVPALYCSLSIMTAVREANQVGSLQPTTLVAYEAELESVFDATVEGSLIAEGMSASAIRAPTWRDEMRAVGEARTQAFARSLMSRGYSALLVPSFARGASTLDVNMVIWQWGREAPARLTLIDDEGRLSILRSMSFDRPSGGQGLRFRGA